MKWEAVDKGDVSEERRRRLERVAGTLGIVGSLLVIVLTLTGVV